MRLLAAVKRDALEEAAEVARSRPPELPINMGEDLLADAVLAATSDIGAQNLATLASELAEDEALPAFIDSVAPGLRARMRASSAPAG